MKSEAIKIIGVLAASFPSAKISSETISAYAQQLDDLPIALLDLAARQCAADCKFFPTMAELRERAAAITMPARGTAADAWGDVMVAMKRVGYYGQPMFDNPITAKVVFNMDWQALCSSENVIADRAHFMKMYDAMVEREKYETKLLPSTVAMRAQLTETNERRQIQGSTSGADAKIRRIGRDGV